MRQYDVKILPLTEQEIEKKVLWYNDPEIRKYLHYTDSFNKNDSLNWLAKGSKKVIQRKEYVIWLIDGHMEIPVGIIGLFEIDRANQKRGFYITVGEKQYQGKELQKSNGFILKICLKNSNFIKYIFILM